MMRPPLGLSHRPRDLACRVARCGVVVVRRAVMGVSFGLDVLAAYLGVLALASMECPVCGALALQHDHCAECGAPAGGRA